MSTGGYEHGEMCVLAPPYFHAVSVFKLSSAMWRRASVLRQRKLAKFYKLIANGDVLVFWENSSGERMMRGN